MDRSTAAARIAAAALMLLLAGAAGVPVPAESQTLTPLTVVGPANDGYKAIYYGVQSGIFKRAGLDVKPTVVNSGAAASAALIGGAADVAYTNSLSLIQAHARGIAMQIVSPGGLTVSEHPFTAMLVLKDSPIKTARDLDGKTFGSGSLQDINAASTLAWVDANGGESKTLKGVEVPASSAVPALEEHRIDAITLNEPSVTQALATGKVRVLAHPIDAIGHRVETAVFVGMAPVIESKRDAMTRFARAMHEAQVYVNAHLPETAQLVSDYSGVPVDQVQKSNRIQDAEYADVRDLQSVVDMLAKYKLIDKSFPASELISSVALKR